jgi:phage head maturation protease
LDVFDTTADGNNLDTQLVAGDSWIAKERHLSEVTTVVCPAYPDAVDTDDRLARTGRSRFRDVHKTKLFRLGKLNSSHSHTPGFR